MNHDLKIWPAHYENKLAGLKPWELRKNDRPFSVGDTMILREWNPMSGRYTGRAMTVKILLIHPIEKTSLVIISDNSNHLHKYLGAE